jgi:hypothetical protein
VIATLVLNLLDRFAVDVPPDMVGCQDCNEPRCHRDRFEKCQRRLAAVAERKAEEDARL